MSQVSKKVLSPKIYQRIFENFLEMMADIKSPKDIREFFKDFLSPTEKVMLSKRMAIAILKSKGFDHRSIASVLKVSTSTVNNVSRQISLKSPGYNLLFKKHSSKQSARDFLEQLEREIYRFSSPGKVFKEGDSIKAKLGQRKNIF